MTFPGTPFSCAQEEYVRRFVNFGRNRTLHCGLTGPLFALGAVVAFLVEAEVWAVDQTILWGAILAGVAVAFLVEWRTVGTQERGSNA
jgi:hypothetical protein